MHAAQSGCTSPFYVDSTTMTRDAGMLSLAVAHRDDGPQSLRKYKTATRPNHGATDECGSASRAEGTISRPNAGWWNEPVYSELHESRKAFDLF